MHVYTTATFVQILCQQTHAALIAQLDKFPKRPVQHPLLVTHSVPFKFIDHPAGLGTLTYNCLLLLLLLLLLLRLTLCRACTCNTVLLSLLPQYAWLVTHRNLHTHAHN
jgi:hypothetical protein